jgi:spore germination protein GerM
MAVKKTSAGKTAKKPPARSSSRGKKTTISLAAIFWIFFLIVIITAFFTLLPSLKNFNFFPKIAEIEKRNDQSPTTPLFKLPKPQEKTDEQAKSIDVPEKKPSAPAQKTQPVSKTPEQKPEKKPVEKPQSQTQEKPKTEKPVEQKTTKPQPEKKPAAPAPVPTTPIMISPPPEKPVETRNRSIYLIQEVNMAPVKVNRNLVVTNTPLKDCVNAILTGPTADERKRGIVSLVPEGSRLLSARVDGSTAFLDFNQEFRYNTRGREGSTAQIKQIVLTATEFANIQNVQFLIDGNIVDFLSEGVVINGPISR